MKCHQNKHSLWILIWSHQNSVRMSSNTESNFKNQNKIKRYTLWKQCYFKQPSVVTHAPLKYICVKDIFDSPMLPLHSNHTKQRYFHFRDKGLCFFPHRVRNWCGQFQYNLDFYLCKRNWRESMLKFTYTWGLYISVSKSENTSLIKR